MRRIFDLLAKLFPRRFAPNAYADLATMLKDYIEYLVTAAQLKLHVFDKAMERVGCGVAPSRAFDGLPTRAGMHLTALACVYVANLALQACAARKIDEPEAAFGIAAYALEHGLRLDEEVATRIVAGTLKWRELVMIHRGELDGEPDPAVEIDDDQIHFFDMSDAAGVRIAAAESKAEWKATGEEIEFFASCCEPVPSA